jgi:hypothetical protein
MPDDTTSPLLEDIAEIIYQTVIEKHDGIGTARSRCRDAARDVINRLADEYDRQHPGEDNNDADPSS